MKNYASFGRRFAAVFIDGLIVGVINMLVSSLTGGLTPTQTYSSGYGYNAPVLGLSFFLNIVIGWGYFIYFIGSRGQTPGKMVMGIKVVNMGTNKNPDYLHAFLREIVGKFISGLFLAIGYLWMLWDKDKQTWHDKIAKTQVVRV